MARTQAMQPHTVKLLVTSGGWIFARCSCGYHSLDYPPLNGEQHALRAADVHIEKVVQDRDEEMRKLGYSE